MSTPHDEYTRLESPAGSTVSECPVCASDAELWRYSESPTAPSSVAVCCSNKTPIGPQDGAVNEGCLLYMPPDAYYRPTIREAIKFWNEYAAALKTLQRTNRWKRASVLRGPVFAATPTTPIPPAGQEGGA